MRKSEDLLGDALFHVLWKMGALSREYRPRQRMLPRPLFCLLQSQGAMGFHKIYFQEDPMR